MGIILSAAAITIGLHLHSIHAPAFDGQNNNNLGLYVRAADGWSIGGYRNTGRRTSLYAGYNEPAGPFLLSVGAISGYQRKCNLGGCWGWSRGAVAPMATISYALPTIGGLIPRIFYVPSVEKGGSHVMHLSVEF